MTKYRKYQRAMLVALFVYLTFVSAFLAGAAYVVFFPETLHPFAITTAAFVCLGIAQLAALYIVWVVRKYTR